jgi:hypothetical protein
MSYDYSYLEQSEPIVSDYELKRQEMEMKKIEECPECKERGTHIAHMSSLVYICKNGHKFRYNIFDKTKTLEK